MKTLIKYPIGEQSFEQLRKGGFLYVDKTAYVERIVSGNKYYFLGRPRRFGKSLFLSTLKCFFEGKRELFTDLYLNSIEWDWDPYPVLYLDLNIVKYQNDRELNDLLEDRISQWENLYDVTPTVRNLSVRFSNVIKAAYEKSGKEVVILVDEYDKPLVNNLHDRARFESYRTLLAEIYSNFKSSADYIRLVFLAGVSRFGKLSVFSGLNNISDISLDIDYAAICGITEEELLNNFKEGISQLATTYHLTEKEIIQSLKKHYDGYHFAPFSPDIYNPYSLLNSFDKRFLRDYWVQSGTPSLLVEQLKRTRADIHEIMDSEVSENSLSGLDLDSVSPIALFYQTGYLTIKDYDTKARVFRLGIPNDEVKEGLFEYILPFYANVQNDDSHVFAFRLQRELEEGKVDEFMKRLESMFAGFSYDLNIDSEKDVRNALYIIFMIIGLNVNAEFRTSDGRIDILVQTNKFIYIIELKFDNSAESALKQIKEKEYALPWAIDDRMVIAIGINFSSQKRRIDSWLSERLN